MVAGLTESAVEAPAPLVQEPASARSKAGIRFMIVYAVLGLVLLVSVVAFVVYALQPGLTSSSAWSSWSPPQGSLPVVAKAIADHVAPNYRLATRRPARRRRAEPSDGHRRHAERHDRRRVDQVGADRRPDGQAARVGEDRDVHALRPRRSLRDRIRNAVCQPRPPGSPGRPRGRPLHLQARAGRRLGPRLPAFGGRLHGYPRALLPAERPGEPSSISPSATRFRSRLRRAPARTIRPRST